jgi:UPF0716 family protein affecting phage T7 exclusion
MGWSGRIYLYVAAAALFYPSTLADLIGVALVLAFLARRWKSGRSWGIRVTRWCKERGAAKGILTEFAELSWTRFGRVD